MSLTHLVCEYVDADESTLQDDDQWSPYICRIENLFMNKFMHMFQSSWSDFTDFERIFVRIKNTISGQLYLHCTVL